MATKPYIDMLKEALNSEFTEIPKKCDVKGPMIDPVLGYDGDGDIQTHKDAANVLERYYFNETLDKGVETIDEQETPEEDKKEEEPPAPPEAPTPPEVEESKQSIEEMEKEVIEKLISDMETNINEQGKPAGTPEEEPLDVDKEIKEKKNGKEDEELEEQSKPAAAVGAPKEEEGVSPVKASSDHEGEDPTGQGGTSELVEKGGIKDAKLHEETDLTEAEIDAIIAEAETDEIISEANKIIAEMEKDKKEEENGKDKKKEEDEETEEEEMEESDKQVDNYLDKINEDAELEAAFSIFREEIDEPLNEFGPIPGKTKNGEEEDEKE